MLSPFAMNVTDRRHDEARKNLANARREARELAEIRREAMIKRKEDKEALDAGNPATGHVGLASRTDSVDQVGVESEVCNPYF